MLKASTIRHESAVVGHWFWEFLHDARRCGEEGGASDSAADSALMQKSTILKADHVGRPPLRRISCVRLALRGAPISCG